MMMMFDAETLRRLGSRFGKAPAAFHSWAIQRQWRTGIGHALYGHLDCHKHNAPTCKGRAQ